jgi:hypothetical protein
VELPVRKAVPDAVGPSAGPAAFDTDATDGSGPWMSSGITRAMRASIAPPDPFRERAIRRCAVFFLRHRNGIPNGKVHLVRWLLVRPTAPSGRVVIDKDAPAEATCGSCRLSNRSADSCGSTSYRRRSGLATGDAWRAGKSSGSTRVARSG